MGLDTSHDAWHGPYSSFNRFRTAIAKTIDINLSLMEGFDGDIPWDNYLEHDLYPFLYHSDCDGELTVEECIKTKNGLEKIVHLLDDLHPFSDKQKALQFIEGCKLAISLNEPIVFH